MVYLELEETLTKAAKHEELGLAEYKAMIDGFDSTELFRDAKVVFPFVVEFDSDNVFTTDSGGLLVSPGRRRWLWILGYTRELDARKSLFSF